MKNAIGGAVCGAILATVIFFSMSGGAPSVKHFTQTVQSVNNF